MNCPSDSLLPSRSRSSLDSSSYQRLPQRFARYLLRLAWSWLTFGLTMTGTSYSYGQIAGVELKADDLGRMSRDARQLEGKTIRAVVVKQPTGRWRSAVEVTSVKAGEPYSAATARRAAEELLRTGRFASVDVRVERQQSGVRIDLWAVPRRIISSKRITGSMLSEGQLWRELGIKDGAEVTEASLEKLRKQIEHKHHERGWPRAHVSIQALPTNDPLQIVLVVQVDHGSESTIIRRYVRPDRQVTDKLAGLLNSYEIDEGDRADEIALEKADRELTKKLRSNRFLQARVEHSLTPRGSNRELLVQVHLGAQTRLKFEGNIHFDHDQLSEAISQDGLPEDQRLATHRLESFYRRRGWLDVRVTVSSRETPDHALRDWVFNVHEGSRVRVTARSYPCLSLGKYSLAEIDEEVDAVLREQLPSSGMFHAMPPAMIDQTYGPRGQTGTRPEPLDLDPTTTYDAEAYGKVVEHLEAMFHSEGYLRARVLPARLIRHGCSAQGHELPWRSKKETQACDAPSAETCAPDPHGRHTCCSKVRVEIPIHLGPRAMLHDVQFRGNSSTTSSSLLKVTDLDMGAPVSTVAIERGRRSILEDYLEEGYAYANVTTKLDLSQDGTRARVTYHVRESSKVYVQNIRIEGAERTSESLIRDRVALKKGEPYRKSLVRKTEQRLASLGVFTSVAVYLQDPNTPATHKTVLVRVQERPSQYMEIRPGFATGEGLRAQLEYGHLNIGGEAIQLVLRARLSYLSDALIQDPTVRENLTKLPISERLERMDTATLLLPQIGLGPLVSFSVTGVDARSNERDFGVTKQALNTMIHYTPVPSVLVDVGASVERNNATVFGGQSIVEYLTQPNVAPGLQRLLLVPDGLTYVVAQQLSASWDIRNSSLDPTRGLMVRATVEHVHSFPGENSLLTVNSDFLRTTMTISTYAPLTKSGVTLAMRLRGGRIFQLLDNSATYPDRLFFLGGVDSMRGFQIDSFMPQDLADEINRTQTLPSDSPEKVTPRSVAIRGGDAFINPRVELRFPLRGALRSAVFIDAGNLWRDPSNADLWRLRYTAGTGLRLQTPIGPIAFDYGLNLVRRSWEDVGAFHFSIGLF